MTSLSDTFKTLLRRSCDLVRRKWKPSTETSLGVSFETSLIRRGNIPMVYCCNATYYGQRQRHFYVLGYDVPPDKT